MNCPECQGATLYFDTGMERYVCTNCGERFCGEDLI